ncbi:3'-5' exoribonuclease domain-containing protein [Sphingomonas koreensis]
MTDKPTPDARQARSGAHGKGNIIVDCEASGPCPGFGDLISFGAVLVEPGLAYGFRSGTIRPECERFDDGAYRAIGMDRAGHLAAADQSRDEAIRDFQTWLDGLGCDRLAFWSDNPAFDWQWINHGFHAAGLRNPFGFSARRIGDLYAGLDGNAGNTQGWKKRRQTAHDHDPLNDARGNAEALLSVLEEHGQLRNVGIRVEQAA